jgi:hypothetical protein
MPSSVLSRTISVLSNASTTTTAQIQQLNVIDEDEENSLKLPTPTFLQEEGPIPHFAVIKLAALDIIASFALTIGFSIIGSGVCCISKQNKHKLDTKANSV